VLAGGAGERPDKSSLLMEVKSLKGPIVEKYYKRWDLSRGKVSMVVVESIREDVSDTMHISPFTLKNMLAIEVDEAAAKQTLDELSEQIANSEFANYLGGGITPWLRKAKRIM
jgi:hypothetical protein